MRALATKLDCQPKQLDEKLTKLLSAYETIAGEKNQLQDLLITNVLKTLAPNGQSTFTYIVDLTAYRLDEIPLRQIINHARVQRPDTNRILTTQTGQYALYAGATKNAKELQATLGLKGGGDDLLVQGKTDSPFVL